MIDYIPKICINIHDNLKIMIEYLRHIRDSRLPLVKFNDDENDEWYYLCDAISFVHDDVHELLTKINNKELTRKELRENLYYPIIVSIEDSCNDMLYTNNEVLDELHIIFKYYKNAHGASEWWNKQKSIYTTQEKFNDIITKKQYFLTQLIERLDGCANE